MDEIDPNELGESLQDKCNKILRQDYLQELQENQNKSEEEFE